MIAKASKGEREKMKFQQRPKAMKKSKNTKYSICTCFSTTYHALNGYFDSRPGRAIHLKITCEKKTAS